MRNLITILSLLTFISCQPAKELPTVAPVDLNKYAGTWFEIAKLPNKFEKGLECITATYTLKENGKVEVLNAGHLVEKDNKLRTIKGTAWVPDAQFPGRLKVRFFWPFSGNYYIIALDENYTYALVGDPSRKYLWVLSKNKNLATDIYTQLLDKAKANGFDTDQVVMVKQDCE